MIIPSLLAVCESISARMPIAALAFPSRVPLMPSMTRPILMFIMVIAFRRTSC